MCSVCVSTVVRWWDAASLFRGPDARQSDEAWDARTCEEARLASTVTNGLKSTYGAACPIVADPQPAPCYGCFQSAASSNAVDVLP